MLKANVLLGKPTSTDISTEEMLHEWEGLNTLPGVACTVKRYETFPTPEEFNALIDADAEAFEPLSRAYAIPKDAPERGEVMERALLRAAGPPMEIMRRCAEALELIGEYAAKGSALAVSDAGCAAALCLAAMRAAALNVLINTKGMADREAAGRLNSEALSLLAEYGGTAEEIYENITGRLS